MLVPIRASRFCRSAVLGQAAVCPTVALLIGECCRRGLRGAPAGAARLSSTPSQEPSQEVQAAVVGSGPAGMYTAQKLLKEYGDGVTVHVLVRWREREREGTNMCSTSPLPGRKSLETE